MAQRRSTRRSERQPRRPKAPRKPRALKTLQRALAAAPSKAALARALDISTSTLRRWEKDGLPPHVSVSSVRSAQKSLRQVERERQRQRRESVRAQRQRIAESRRSMRTHRIRELMKLARRTADAATGKPLLPKRTTEEGRRVGPLTVGYFWTREFDAEVTPDVISLVRKWVQGFSSKRKFPLWQVVAFVSEFGSEAERIGSGPLPVQFPGEEDSGEFRANVVVGGLVSSRLAVTLGEMLSQLERASDGTMLSWLHAVSVLNFRKRTEEQRRAYETRERNRRAREESQASRAGRSKKTTRKKLTKKTTGGRRKKRR